ncbi:hypothetical protein TgHK011_002554 [Trichoderma gracile]|nr:hypothetical protein TgHK011_002554 [Trichoderma gracile]
MADNRLLAPPDKRQQGQRRSPARRRTTTPVAQIKLTSNPSDISSPHDRPFIQAAEWRLGRPLPRNQLPVDARISEAFKPQTPRKLPADLMEAANLS